MPLEDYDKKRDFRQTPEPGPTVKSSPAGNLYVIQKHAARRLHYDLRLELNGVLKSWAVPKGPSLDPADKHLAVHVEDHPLDYADFEGTIPKGEYGGGTVMVWDVGTWEPAEETAKDPEKSYREGKFKFRLHGEKLRGGWMLVRLKPRPEDRDAENWLLFKERDDEARSGPDAKITELAADSVQTGRSMEQIAADADRVWRSEGDSPGEQPREVVERMKEQAAQDAGSAERKTGRAGGPTARTRAASVPEPVAVPDPSSIPGALKAPMPDRIEPELATLVAAAPDGGDWVHEIKFDGYRVHCRLENGAARFLTRRGADWTNHFPTLVEPVRHVPGRQILLDGEVVYVKDDGRTSFLRLASALQSGTDAEGRIVYYVFDLLYLDGYDLTGAPLHARKAALRELLAGFAPAAHVRYVDHLEGSGPEFFRQACEHSLEGAISKRRDAPYRSGRGRDWVKTKCMRRQEFVIGGFTDLANGRVGIGALLMGYHEEPGGPLYYAGRVGTGWDEKTMRDIRGRLEELEQREPAFSDPPHGREAKGVHWVAPELVAEVEYLTWTARGLFRHPSFEGLRLDKPATDVVPEQATNAPLTPFAAPTQTAAAARSPEAAAEETTVAAAATDGASEDTAPTGSSSDADNGSPRHTPSDVGDGSAPAPPVEPIATRKVRKGERHEVVGGVVITNPDKVMYPDVGVTKLEIARYYEEVADWLLPYVSDRPLTIVRCPEGYTRQCFFQKHASEGFPEVIKRVQIPEDGGSGVYVAIDSVAGLLSLVQMGVLELHVWGSRIETLETPDQIVFDLDPDPELPFGVVVQGARLMRTALDGLGLQSFVKTTGGKGLHVVAPIEPSLPWDEVKGFTKALAEAIVAADPDHYTANMAKKKRTGKVYIDFLRNGRGATYITAYSTRRRPGAPVATPLRWDELSPSLSAGQYGVRNIRRRLAGLKEDPWAGFSQIRQAITPDMRRALGAAPSERRRRAS